MEGPVLAAAIRWAVSLAQGQHLNAQTYIPGIRDRRGTAGRSTAQVFQGSCSWVPSCFVWREFPLATLPLAVAESSCTP
ncbi:hypothetical protein B0J13DRAFT_546192 [Dactylonectria estremocensis]|uniref:Uncharacterized protein n=1 Tax=Dactylonectria estremocensis TaxID=1079267 RepID=A0A9P9F6K2_9HYPO|nr:hypothetical protein B0J13DRAFT_546192 [Dactylonectria estremocensis]